jgi:hypothetical protein
MPALAALVEHGAGAPVRLEAASSGAGHGLRIAQDAGSGIRVDASFLQPDGSSGRPWNICMKGPGEFQLDESQRREGAGR